MEKPYDESAFPNSADPNDPAPGMTLRDWFAGQALQGLIVNPATVSPTVPISVRAYELADALLAEREK